MFIIHLVLMFIYFIFICILPEDDNFTYNLLFFTFFFSCTIEIPRYLISVGWEKNVFVQWKKNMFFFLFNDIQY